MFRFCIPVFLLLLLAPALQAQPDFKARISQTAQDKARSDAEHLHALFALSQEWQEEISPEGNTWRGKPKHQDKWTDMSLPAIEGRRETQRQFQQAFKNIDRNKLSKQDQLNYDLFTRSLSHEIEGYQFPGHLMPVSKTGGFQTSVPQLLGIMRLQTEADYHNYLVRLERLPAYVEQHMALMQEGMKRGIMPPRITMQGVAEQVQSLLTEDAKQNPLLAPVQQFPGGVPAARQQELRTSAEKTVREKVNPALRKLHTFLEKTYLPKTRETIAFTALPNGTAWYNHAIKGHTTTSLTYDQIHETGQAEVKRIRAEMDKVIAATGFKGSFADFAHFLRTDPQFFYNTPEELLTGYRDICKRIDPELPRLFGRLPRLPYGVIPCPPTQRKRRPPPTTCPAPPKAAAPATIYANTYDLKCRPKWEMEALTLHEAVPGHHLQIALAQELEDVPEFRKRGQLHRLRRRLGAVRREPGPEMGFYQDPYAQVRPAHLRDVARHPAGGGHRHARQGLDPPAGHRVLQGQRRQDRARHHRRDRPLHRLARTGAGLQAGRAEAQGAARPRHPGAGRKV